MILRRALLALIAAMPGLVLACSCGWPRDGLQGQVARARVVAVVRVTAAETISDPSGESDGNVVRARFVVVESLKGDSTSIESLISPISFCGIDIAIGHEYLVYAHDRERAAFLHYCGGARDLGAEGGTRDAQVLAIRRYLAEARPIGERDNWLGVPPPPPPPKAGATRCGQP
ncbi:hypothetical protein [Lysobacter sp. Hz 25]|uniref:hypothetical protein n=1 Tax=Lysobacter sp. Hz 25 TaxID=3383698 RepID=UPI0038D46239